MTMLIMVVVVGVYKNIIMKKEIFDKGIKIALKIDFLRKMKIDLEKSVVISIGNQRLDVHTDIHKDIETLLLDYFSETIIKLENQFEEL